MVICWICEKILRYRRDGSNLVVTCATCKQKIRWEGILPTFRLPEVKPEILPDVRRVA